MSIISKELLKLNLKAGLLIKIKFNKDTEKSYKVNGRVLLKILKLNCKSEIGIKYNFKDIKCIKDFKENFPITNYDFYEDYIEKMVNGKRIYYLVEKLNILDIHQGQLENKN